ncbi:MAG: rhomboid family intramembrane serine protease [Rhodospirillaceae bacterium]|nr:rhomboid family intramembrane serine protease [Rhodospirillaceae bacterium]
MIFPIGSTAPRSGWPVATLALIAACCLVFLWQESLPREQAFRLVADYALIPRRYADARWAVWHGLDPRDRLPLISMAFLHGGWLHVVLNMWTLWLFGRSVERRLGWPRFLLIYLLCALLAAWAHLAVYPESPVPVLGASGAIAGILGASAVLFPRARVIVLILVVVVPLIFRVPALLYAGLWFGLQVLQGANTLLHPTFGGGVAWWAHIGGFVAGLALAHLLAPPQGPAVRPQAGS